MNLEECIEYIGNWYFSDTIGLFDLILNDDIANPQYSAITTLNRLLVYLKYKTITNNSYKCNDVSALLKNAGYTQEDIDLFKKKALKERKIYTADILDTEFFNI